MLVRLFLLRMESRCRLFKEGFVLARVLLKLEGFMGSMGFDSYTLKPVRSRLRSRWHVESPLILRKEKLKTP